MQTTRSFAYTGSVWKSILLLFPMALLILLFISGGKPKFSGINDIIAFLLTFFFFCYLFFQMIYTGKTDRYRATGFIVLSLFFALTFIVNLVHMRGSMSFSKENLLSCEIPFCHIATTMVLIPAAVKQSIIFPGSILEGFASIASMLVIVIGISLALGRGFCSWGCFYGGWEEGASRILRKPKIKKLHSALRWMPFAVLLLVALSSAVALSPTYCSWLCPFKTITEYEKVTNLQTLFKTFVFLSIFAGLVLVLPLLTKKRMQCATFCPMGALLSFTNKINVFEVKIDKKKCNNCHVCIKACPTLSMDIKDIENSRPSMTCTKCGKCIDACSKQALQYHIKGTPINKHLTLARTLFLFPSFTLLVIFTGGTMQQGLSLLMKLLITGRLI
jgi:ferredoxin-type protein NapH